MLFIESTFRHKLEERGCPSMVKGSEQELLLSKRTAGRKMERNCRNGSPVTSPTWDPSQGEISRRDTITDAMVCLQTGALAWRSSKRLNKKFTEIYADTYT